MRGRVVGVAPEIRDEATFSLRAKARHAGSENPCGGQRMQLEGSYHPPSFVMIGLWIFCASGSGYFPWFL